MIPTRSFLAAFLTAASVMVGQTGAHAATYSDQQLELAGRIGAAVALSRICSGTVPTTAVLRALEANGLTEGDVLGDTPIRERMQRQASEVMSASRLRGEGGRSQAEIVRSACAGFRASFGPNGFLPPEAAD